MKVPKHIYLKVIKVLNATQQAIAGPEHFKGGEITLTPEEREWFRKIKFCPHANAIEVTDDD